MMYINKKHNEGFTLVELLIAIAIIGILATVAVPNLFSSIEKAKVAELEADITAIKTAATSFYIENNEYPYGEILDNDFTSEDPRSNLKGFEIEHLSDPFKSLSYKLIGKVGSGLDLVICLPDENKISERALNKILRDIHGSSYYEPNNAVTIPILQD
ncbi:MAG: type IV pilin protein [Peptostreptococcaceae bacterium]